MLSKKTFLICIGLLSIHSIFSADPNKDFSTHNPFSCFLNLASTKFYSIGATLDAWAKTAKEEANRITERAEQAEARTRQVEMQTLAARHKFTGILGDTKYIYYKFLSLSVEEKAEIVTKIIFSAAIATTTFLFLKHLYTQLTKNDTIEEQKIETHEKIANT